MRVIVSKDSYIMKPESFGNKTPRTEEEYNLIGCLTGTQPKNSLEIHYNKVMKNSETTVCLGKGYG